MLIEGMFHLLVSAAPNCTKDCLCRTEPSICFSFLFCFAGIVLFELLNCGVTLCAVPFVRFCYRLFISPELMFSASLFLSLAYCFFFCSEMAHSNGVFEDHVLPYILLFQLHIVFHVAFKSDEIHGVCVPALSLFKPK